MCPFAAACQAHWAAGEQLPLRTAPLLAAAAAAAACCPGLVQGACCCCWVLGQHGRGWRVQAAVHVKGVGQGRGMARVCVGQTVLMAGRHARAGGAMNGHACRCMQCNAATADSVGCSQVCSCCSSGLIISIINGCTSCVAPHLHRQTRCYRPSLRHQRQAQRTLSLFWAASNSSLFVHVIKANVQCRTAAIPAA